MVHRYLAVVNTNKTLQKNRFTVFITFLLAALTLAVGGVGIYTYKNLGKMVEQLPHESGPYINLVILKDIMVSISGIENDMEAYLLTENKTYINRYNQRINDATQYLDSLQNINTEDKDLIRYTDSLKSLVDKKVDILNQFQHSISFNISGTIDDFAEKVEKIPIETKKIIDQEPLDSNKDNSAKSGTITVQEQDTVKAEKEKKGFFKSFLSIFSKDKTQQDSTIKKEAEKIIIESSEKISKETDSSFIAQKTKEYRSALQNEIYNLRQKSSDIGKRLREKELQLSQSQQTIQNQIIDLLTYLEEREIDKIKIKNYNAQVIARETNDQVTIFSVLTTIMLLATLLIMWSYFHKNKAYQKILRKATSDAKRLAKSKEQFLANMSHEIRTPMNAISGFTQQLLKTKLDPEQKDQLDIIYRSSDHLLHILNDVLDFSKLQAEKLRLSKKDFNLPILMTDSIKLMRQKATEKNLRLNYTVQDIPEAVVGDPYRLRQILFNLISNSIKFTEKGEVNVSLTTKRKTRSGIYHLELIVQDTGIGIPKDQQDRILMEFEQAGDSSDHKGTGLGLSITKKLVLLHGGKMKLKSVYGEGTEISAIIPFKEGNLTSVEPTVEQSTRSLDRLSILIADDEPYNIKLLATMLKDTGARWDEVSDGISAIAALNQKKKFDLAILDIKMPGKSGLEVAKELRASNSINSQIPLIALTATVSKEDYDQCIQNGFNKILRKPINESDLLNTIHHSANIKKNSNPPKEETKVESTQPQYSVEGLKKMGDQYFVMEMIQTFIESAENSIHEMKKYFEAKDWKNLSNEAHKIVAPARHLEATEIVSILKDIENKANQSDPQIQPDKITLAEQKLKELIHKLKKHIKSVSV